MNSAEERRIDESYMRMALSLAMRGTGTTSPNPRVGCVIVKDGEIIGKGWHRKYGGPHAEVEAAADVSADISGSDVYVTLEPCCHYGKTPPCAHMLADRRVKRVIIGTSDPNPLVDCKGISVLENAGIEVKTGVLEEECKWLNRGFISRIRHNRPWVLIKSGASIDGNISLSNGESKWITEAKSRRIVQLLRSEADALLTGVGTVIADDPELTVRECDGRTPLRIVLDRNLRTPLSAKIFAGGNLIFFADAKTDKNKISDFEKNGARVIVPEESSSLDIKFILSKLSENGVNYLMVESGASVTSSFIESGCADEFALFAAPKIMGHGVHFSEKIMLHDMSKTITLKNIETEMCGDDLYLKGVFSCSPDL